MVDTSIIVLGVVMFTVIVLGLVAVILAARSRLVSSGDVAIEINGDPDNTVTTQAGGKLLQTLAANGITPLPPNWDLTRSKGVVISTPIISARTEIL